MILGPLEPPGRETDSSTAYTSHCPQAMTALISGRLRQLLDPSVDGRLRHPEVAGDPGWSALRPRSVVWRCASGLGEDLAPPSEFLASGPMYGHGVGDAFASGLQLHLRQSCYHRETIDPIVVAVSESPPPRFSTRRPAPMLCCCLARGSMSGLNRRCPQRNLYCNIAAPADD